MCHIVLNYVHMHLRHNDFGRTPQESVLQFLLRHFLSRVNEADDEVEVDDDDEAAEDMQVERFLMIVQAVTFLNHSLTVSVKEKNLSLK